MTIDFPSNHAVTYHYREMIDVNCSGFTQFANRFRNATKYGKSAFSISFLASYCSSLWNISLISLCNVNFHVFNTRNILLSVKKPARRECITMIPPSGENLFARNNPLSSAHTVNKRLKHSSLFFSIVREFYRNGQCSKKLVRPRVSLG